MTRTTCLICDAPTKTAPASIAPFIIETSGMQDRTTETCYCSACDLAFFARRYTDVEASQIYNDYRGKAYNDRRVSVEPGYAPLIPIFDDPLSGYYIERIKDYIDVFDVYRELPVATVLDFGGDGTFPRRIFPNAKVSFMDLSAGSSHGDNRQYDVIFASQVLEHVSDPVETLRAVSSYLAPNGVICVDVPKEYDSSLSEALLVQERFSGQLYTMHEHINFFSHRSLEQAIRKAGLSPFFQITTMRHATFLALCTMPGSETGQRLLTEATPRTTAWLMNGLRTQLNNLGGLHAKVDLGIREAQAARAEAQGTRAEAQGAHVEAQGAHTYARLTFEGLARWTPRSIYGRFKQAMLGRRP